MPIPEAPRFTVEQLPTCRSTGDYMPVLFEWHQFVGSLCLFFACIRRESPAVRDIESVNYAILIGLLNRCARLMLSNVALSHEGRFGETTALLDRCIFESCLKIEWLCQDGTDEAFRRYIADGLNSEIELKARIELNIKTRQAGKALKIEERMLSSIERHIKTANLTEVDIAGAKRLPSIASMIELRGEDRLSYIVNQRIWSHHVHGTWPSLLMHYLEVQPDGSFELRDHDCETHEYQFIFTALNVLRAMRAFTLFIVPEQSDRESLEQTLTETAQEIMRINDDLLGDDFAFSEGT